MAPKPGKTPSSIPPRKTLLNSNPFAYYEEEEENPNLRDFLAEKDMYTLNAGIDNLEDENNKVLLMTLHNAKGLEFNNVFLRGNHEGSDSPPLLHNRQCH